MCWQHVDLHLHYANCGIRNTSLEELQPSLLPLTTVTTLPIVTPVATEGLPEPVRIDLFLSKYDTRTFFPYELPLNFLD